MTNWQQKTAVSDKRLKHCEDCGGSWVDDGINSGCYCLRLREAERQRDEALALLADVPIIPGVQDGEWVKRRHLLTQAAKVT